MITRQDIKHVGAASATLAGKSVLAANAILCSIELEIQEARQIARGRNKYVADMEELIQVLNADNTFLQNQVLQYQESLRQSEDACRHLEFRLHHESEIMSQSCEGELERALLRITELMESKCELIEINREQQVRLERQQAELDAGKSNTASLQQVIAHFQNEIHELQVKLNESSHHCKLMEAAHEQILLYRSNERGAVAEPNALTRALDELKSLKIANKQLELENARLRSIELVRQQTTADLNEHQYDFKAHTTKKASDLGLPPKPQNGHSANIESRVPVAHSNQGTALTASRFGRPTLEKSGYRTSFETTNDTMDAFELIDDGFEGSESMPTEGNITLTKPNMQSIPPVRHAVSNGPAKGSGRSDIEDEELSLQKLCELSPYMNVF